MRKIVVFIIVLLISFSTYSQEEEEKFYEEGKLHLEKEDFTEAIESFTKAIELNPNFDSAFCDRSIANHNLEDFQGALKDINRAIELNAEDGFYFFRRGLIWVELQYVDMTKIEREEITNGLLKYCELDTLAMVMIYEHFRFDILNEN